MKAVVLTYPQLLAAANEDVYRLGRWTTRISEISVHQERFLVQPWSHDELRAALVVSRKWYIHFLPKVIEALRSLNQDPLLTDKSWEIIVGWWLAAFLDVLVVRHLECQEALTAQPDLNFVPIDQPVPHMQEGSDLLGIFTSDEFNGWLYSYFLTHKIPSEEPKISVVEKDSDGIHSEIYDALHQICSLGSQIVYTSSISRRNLPMFFLKSLGRVKKLTFLLPKSNAQVNHALRQKFFELLAAKSNLEVGFARLIATLAPTSYLECFPQMRQETLKFLPKRYTQFFSTVEIVYSESYKFAAAFSKSLYGSVLYGMQHGGVYSAVEYMHTQEIEQSLSDHWFSWGAITAPKDLLIRSLHLSSFCKSASSDPNGDVLMILGAYPLFTYMISAVPQGAMAFDYFEVLKEFILNVKKSGNIQIRVRPQLAPHKWDCDHFEDLDHFAGGKITRDTELDIKSSVSKARLVIITTNSTTLLEVLAANIPALILLPKHLWPFNKKFAAIFAELELHKILHSTPASLYEHLNSIYSDPKLWWLSEKVQSARKLFCDNLAVT